MQYSLQLVERIEVRKKFVIDDDFFETYNRIAKEEIWRPVSWAVLRVVIVNSRS